MKIVLAYAYGTTNAGDHALTLGALRLLKDAAPEADVTVISRYSKYEEPSEASKDIADKFPDVKVVPSPFAFSRDSTLSRSLEKGHGFLLVLFALLLPSIAVKLARKNAALKEIADADIVLCNGGNLFYWNRYRKSLPRLIALLFPSLLARRLGIPYGFLPQTMGPFEGRAADVIFRDVFEHAEFILFREGISLDNARAVADLKKTVTAVVPDLAFVPRDVTEESEEALPALPVMDDQGPFLTVTLRASQLGDPEVAKKGDVSATMADEVAQYMAALIAPVAEEEDLKVVVVIQTSNDVEVSHRFANVYSARTGQEALVVEEREPKVLSKLYARAELLVGMRLHSMIFALRRDTPVMGVYMDHFGPKIEGTLEMFGLGEYSVRYEDMPAEAARERLLDLSRQRHGLSQRVRERRHELVQAASSLVKSSLEEIVADSSSSVIV